MRRILPFLLALALAQVAFGALRIVNSAGVGVPTQVMIQRDDGTLYLETTNSTHSTIATGMSASTGAGDTLYVHTGTWVGRIVPGAWDASSMVLIGAYDFSTLLRTDNPGYTLGCADTTRTGCSVEYFVIDGGGATVSSAAFEVTQARNFTIKNCKTQGALKGIFTHGGGNFAGGSYGADGLTVIDCEFASNYSAGSQNSYANTWAASSTDMPTDVNFTNVLFNLTDLNVTTGSFDMAAFRRMTFTTCTFKMANIIGNAQGFGIRTRGDATGVKIPKGLHFYDCTFIGSDNLAFPLQGVGLIHISGNLGTVGGTMDSLTIMYSTILPVTKGELNFGLKVENDYAAGTGADNTFIDNINISHNVFVGGYVPLGFMENSRNFRAVGNRIYGAGKLADAGFNTFGIVMEDARHGVVSGNKIYNVQKAIDFSFSGGNPSTPAFNNYKIDLFNNEVYRSDFFVWVNCAEGETMPADSLLNGLRSSGNIAIGVTNWGHMEDAAPNDFTLGEWKAMTMINVPAYWVHGQGDVESESWPSNLRRVNAIDPQRRLGAGPGLD